MRRKPEPCRTRTWWRASTRAVRQSPSAGSTAGDARRVCKACDPIEPSGTRRRGRSRRRPSTTGPHTARVVGAACRSRGARRCASRSPRRSPSVYLCRTSRWISSWTSKTAGRRGRKGSRPSAMRDGVRDRTASHQSEYKEYSALRRDDGGIGRHLTAFRSGSLPSEHTEPEEQPLPTCSEKSGNQPLPNDDRSRR
jgi:hypothetical protein